MSEFTLNGGFEKVGDKFKAIVLLRTPDGRETKLESEPIYASEGEAMAATETKLDEVLTLFRKDGVEVLSRNGVKYA